MVSVAFFDENKSEMDKLYKIAYRHSAFICNDDFDFNLFSSAKVFDKYLSNGGSPDFGCIDVVTEQGAVPAEILRSNAKNCFIMLISDKTVSPMLYLKPSVMPGALLMRPFDGDEATRILRDALKQCIGSRFSDNEDVFVFSSDSAQRCLAYSQIYFFEARDKKIYVNTGSREYCFYDTMDNLSESLPAGFIRCHRSYIISKSKIEKIYLSKNYIELDNGMEIPLSRSCKEAVKELM